MILLAIDAAQGTLTRYESDNVAPRADATHRFVHGTNAQFTRELIEEMRYAPLRKHKFKTDPYYFLGADAALDS